MVTGTAFGTTLEEARNSFLANVALVPSGSVTYKIVDHRPKNNLLDVVPGYRQVPIIDGESDVTLNGFWSFKWEGEKFIAHRDKVSLSTLPGSLPLTEVHEMIDSWNGSVGKSYSADYSSTADILQGPATVNDRGNLLERSGEVRPKAGVLKVTYQPVSCFCASVREIMVFFRRNVVSLTEEGLLQLTGSSPERSVTLDPARGYMPVTFRNGGATMQVTYSHIAGVWFPTRWDAERRDGETLLNSMECEVISHEFNIDYPDSDFDFQFPAGTPVEDEIQGTEYIAVAN